MTGGGDGGGDSGGHDYDEVLYPIEQVQLTLSSPGYGMTEMVFYCISHRQVGEVNPLLDSFAWQ